MPPGVLFGQFWAPASKCPKECFLGAFWRFLGLKTPKSTQKALFGALRGRCPKLPKKHSGGALSGPGPRSTPVNGGWDRKTCRNSAENLRIFKSTFYCISAGPKRGCLNVGGLKSAGKRQESATFLQRSNSNVAVQFIACCSAAFGKNNVRTAEKPMLQCNFCSAAVRKLHCNFRFRWWHVAGVGFRGLGFRTCAEILRKVCRNFAEALVQVSATTLPE